MSDTLTDVQKKEAAMPEGSEPTRAVRLYTPNVDIIERKDGIELIADMPGVDESSIDITLEKHILSIYGKVEPENPEGYRPVYSEYGIGDYRRSFTLSEEIDSDGISASVKDGVLRLVLPKAEKAKSRKIPVKSA